MSKIEWTGRTWNPIAGCTVLSPGCSNCYAMRMAGRLALMGQEKYAGTTRQSGGRAVWTGQITLDVESLEQPYEWKRPTTVFVNSMSDLFHDAVPLEYIQRTFEVMRATPQHTYQILTKRAERLSADAGELLWSDNVWMGVSVENGDYLSRIDALRTVPAKLRFLSLEPLLGPLPALDLTGIHWVIVGGESGPRARLMQPEWAADVRDQCSAAGVPFFFKQWGSTLTTKNKAKAGRLLDGRLHDAMP
jgi:protein gp37